MNGLYDILLLLFILGASTQVFNELHMFSMSAPDTGITPLDDSSVRELHAGASSTGSSDYSAVEILFAFMKVIGMGIMAMFTIIPMVVTWMVAFGIKWELASGIALILQAPITFVTLFGLYEFWTGRAAS